MPQKIWIILFFVTSLISCADEEDKTSNIPQSAVSIDISYKNEPEFDNPYYYKKYYTGKNAEQAGYAGVLAITLYNSNGLVTLYAYDLCCPYEAPLKNELEVVEDNWTLKCPKCKSDYSLLNEGRPKSGPAADAGKRLRGYAVYKDAVFYRIRN